MAVQHQKSDRFWAGALMLYMSKAFDREWKFLEAIMIKMGFVEAFVKLIMRCISSVTYYIFTSPEQNQYLSAGISLLNSSAAGLSVLLAKAETEKRFKGVKKTYTFSYISHLFFVDDSLIFFRVSEQECNQLKRCIQTYERASGQLVNYDKSVRTFSPSTSPDKIQVIQNIFSIDVVKGHNLYLRLPTFSLRSKHMQFSGIRERTIIKVNGWASRFFSSCGKETLIKSVLQAIPNYVMSCFRIPTSLCNELEHMYSKFWWTNSNIGGLHWSRSCDMNIVRTYFTSFDADYILDIPLGRLKPEDLRYWKWGSRGPYMVKMSYFLENWML
ncbi:uncharacterized protein LOC142526100 [Primulina tabacum]|uniref:uncharacterized protein LOC142526100 n=1 Tax=Primulina tabacum TaxID=48773 RepID=UPI003F5959E9